MSDDHVGVKINGVIYVKLEDVKPLRKAFDAAQARIERLEAERDDAVEQIALTRGLADYHKSQECMAIQNEIVAQRDAAQARIAALTEQVNKLLDHCPDSECDTCGEIICPHKDQLHFHHDGCPSCTLMDDDR